MKAQQIDWCACASEVHATICGKGESELAMEPSRLYENAIRYHEAMLNMDEEVAQLTWMYTIDANKDALHQREHEVMAADFELKQAHYAIKYPQFA